MGDECFMWGTSAEISPSRCTCVPNDAVCTWNAKLSWAVKCIGESERWADLTIRLVVKVSSMSARMREIGNISFTNTIKELRSHFTELSATHKNIPKTHLCICHSVMLHVIARPHRGAPSTKSNQFAQHFRLMSVWYWYWECLGSNICKCVVTYWKIYE